MAHLIHRIRWAIGTRLPGKYRWHTFSEAALFLEALNEEDDKEPHA